MRRIYSETWIYNEVTALTMFTNIFQLILKYINKIFHNPSMTISLIIVNQTKIFLLLNGHWLCRLLKAS